MYLKYCKPCINPVLYYNMKVGLLRENDGRFYCGKRFENFEVLQTYINGALVAEEGKSKIKVNNQIL